MALDYGQRSGFMPITVSYLKNVLILEVEHFFVVVLVQVVCVDCFADGTFGHTAKIGLTHCAV